MRARGMGGTWIVRIERLALAVALAPLGCARDAPSAPPGAWPGFAEPVLYDAGAWAPTRPVVADVGGDGWADLLVVDRHEPAVRLFRSAGGGTFAAPVTIAMGQDTRDAAVADVDGDGTPDLLATGHLDNALYVRRGLGGGQFGAEAQYPLRNHGHFVVRADLDGDRFEDVLAVHDGSGQPVYVTAFLGTASGAPRQAWEAATSEYTARGVAVGDFDGDRRRDVAVALADDDVSVLVYFGEGNGAFAPPLRLPTLSAEPLASDGTTSIAAGDLDGDGRDDLVVTRQDVANELVVHLSTGRGFATPRRIALPSPIDADLGDVDGDGRLDVVAANLEHGSVSVLFGRGDGTFAPARAVAAGPSPGWVVVAALDGDRFADVAVVDLLDRKVRVLLSR